MPIPTPTTVRERAVLLEKAKVDAQFRAKLRAQAAADPVFFINTFLWTFDPRPTAPEPDLPFLLEPFQVDLIHRYEQALAEHDDVIVEKSRDMGVTWLTLAWILYGWIFRPGFQALIGSYTEDLVWNKALDSHFGKLEYMLQRLPGWLRPRGFSFEKHFRKLRLTHPGNGPDAALRGNTIRGASATGRFGRQGRYTVVYIDEAGFWEDFSSAWRAAGSTTKTRIAVSTPNGMNSWGKLVHHPGMQRKRVTLHWSLSPRHDQAWYEAECARLVNEEDIAQELEISYHRSQRGRVYPAWDHVEIGTYDYDPRWATFVSWDFGLDTTALIWWQRDPVTGQVRMLDCYRNSQKPIDFYVPFVTGEVTGDNPYLRDYSADELAKMTVHAQWGTAIHYGDPSVTQRDLASGRSPHEILREHGIYVFTNPAARDHKTRKRFTELGLRGLQVNVPDDPDNPVSCAGVDDAMRLYHYPARNPDAQRTSEINRPVHDDSSHFATAVEYFFVNLPPHRRATHPESYTEAAIYDSLI